MTRTRSVEPFIETNDRELQDSGVPSTAAIAGHPLHPLLVTFPIAFWVGAWGTDIGYWLTNDLFWARASFWLIGVGLVTGILAAITGMMDFTRIGRVRERKAGWIHMVGNVAALLLAVFNLVLRWDNLEGSILPTGLLISTLISTILGVTGWYGGELVYRHKIAVVGEGNPHHAP